MMIRFYLCSMLYILSPDIQLQCFWKDYLYHILIYNLIYFNIVFQNIEMNRNE
jgi:hypothetical protein